MCCNFVKRPRQTEWKPVLIIGSDNFIFPNIWVGWISLEFMDNKRSCRSLWSLTRSNKSWFIRESVESCFLFMMLSLLINHFRFISTRESHWSQRSLFIVLWDGRCYHDGGPQTTAPFPAWRHARPGSQHHHSHQHQQPETHHLTRM